MKAPVGIFFPIDTLTVLVLLTVWSLLYRYYTFPEGESPVVGGTASGGVNATLSSAQSDSD